MDEQWQTSQSSWSTSIFLLFEQLCLASQFFNCFAKRTVATFNTNERWISLSTLLGGLNINKTFFFPFCFIISKEKSTFEFVET